MLTLVSCPECGVPAEVNERFSLPSTDGPVAHVAVGCVAGHHFRMPSELLSRSSGYKLTRHAGIVVGETVMRAVEDAPG